MKTTMITKSALIITIILFAQACAKGAQIQTGGSGGTSADTSEGGATNATGGTGSADSTSGTGASGGDTAVACAQEQEGAKQHCYTGPKGTKDIGLCHGGTQTCHDGIWGPCKDEITPQPEECDGLDHNCDNVVDYPRPKYCYTGPDGTAGKGICHGGTRTCTITKENNQIKAIVGPCIDEQTPQKEECNGQDNNCDGDIDHPDDKEYYNGPEGTQGKGICHGGTLTCKDNQWQILIPDQEPLLDENCSKPDNNCTCAALPAVSQAICQCGFDGYCAGKCFKGSCQTAEVPTDCFGNP